MKSRKLHPHKLKNLAMNSLQPTCPVLRAKIWLMNYNRVTVWPGSKPFPSMNFRWSIFCIFEHSFDFKTFSRIVWFTNVFSSNKTDSWTILEQEDCLLDDFGILRLRFQRHMILHLIKLSFEGIHRRLLNQSFNQVKNQYTQKLEAIPSL